MHSVVVLGDCRQHRYFDKRDRKKLTPADEPLEETSRLGGVFFMREAIERMLGTLTYDAVHPRPELFSHVIPPYGNASDVDGFGTIEWDLKESVLSHPLVSGEKNEATNKNERLRLWTPRQVEVGPSTVWPPLDEKLVRALGAWTAGVAYTSGAPLPVGHFDPPGKSSSFCPDIVVFDDLGGPMRHLTLESPARWVNPERTAWTRPPRVDNSPNEAENKRALSLLLARLRHATVPPAQPASGVGRLEPVVICSIKDAPPTLDPARLAADSLWGALARDRNLRRRTVILLDANDLRKYCQFAIGSGSSWENTAQDTIAELRRSKELRGLFEFSQVIVRFGYTGALHVTRRDEREWTYQLYFDPERDDAAWCNPDGDETVLGESALFVATLIRHLTRVCMERNDEPVLGDLSATIGEAIPSAIRACQRLMNLGYGSPREPRIGEGQWFSEELFESLSASPDGLIAAATIPPTRNRTWSVLSDVTHARVGRIARDIVKYGVRASLLQSVPRLHEYASAYAEAMCDVIRQNDGVITNPRVEDLAEFLNRLDGTTAAEEHRVPQNFARTILRQLTRLPRVRADEYLESALGPAPDAGAGLGWRPPPRQTDARPAVPFPYAEVGRVVRACTAGIAGLGTERIQDFTAYRTKLNAIIEEMRGSVSAIVRRDFELPPGDPVAAPVFRLGDDRFFLDRREIEGVRDIKKLIQMHLDAVAAGREDPTRLRPLSLAVFGPPGAGKSVAVKGVIEAFKEHKAHPEILDAFNLAQCSRVDDLATAFGKITDSCAKNKVPIAFFDEFDSPFQENELGWLKFFLSPMEDGHYGGRPVHTAVFVFAGGTSPTFTEFSLETRPNTDPQVQAFGRAKGPDFVSRLKGHMDVVGVNPADSDDSLYLIRRAAVVRSILGQVQNLKDDTEAKIDNDILRAILFVPHYRNGARSIRKLIEMCRGAATRVTNSALPPINQLNMVTDGKAFLDLLYRVSAE